MTTWLHEDRLAAVHEAVRAGGAARVLDLGCGDGDLFVRLAVEPGIARLVGLDISAEALETIEHVPPERLSRLERAIFSDMRPWHVVITTPNAEFNPLLGVPPHRFRHPDHRFEWTRARFRHWAERAASAAGYDVALHDVAGCHPDLGGASQMAVFDRKDHPYDGA